MYQKIDKWITQTEYVHLETGEKITKYEALKLITKNKKYHVQINTQRDNTGRNLKVAVRTITYECSENGRQRDLWE